MGTMTVSQALRRIKKIKGALTEHLDHAARGVTHLADQEPAFAFKASLELAGAARTEMLDLQASVAAANVKTIVDFDGEPMSLARAARTLAELKGEIAWVRSLSVKDQSKTVEATQVYDARTSAYVHGSRTWTCHLAEVERVKLVTSLQDKFDRLNDLVETANHKTLV